MSTGLKKNLNSSSRFSNFACSGQVLVYFLSFLVADDLPGPLPIRQERIKLMLLVRQENLLVLGDWMDFF